MEILNIIAIFPRRSSHASFEEQQWAAPEGAAHLISDIGFYDFLVATGFLMCVTVPFGIRMYLSPVFESM